MPRASLVVRRHVIDEAGVIIDKSAIQPGVAKLITPGMGGGIDRPPTNRRVPGDPHVVSAKTSRRLELAKAHQAFARGRIVRKDLRQGSIREKIGGAQVIDCLDVESNQRAFRLPGDRGAVNAVPGDRIAAGSVVHHRDIGQGAVGQTIVAVS